MLNIFFAIVLFFLGRTDAWGQGDTWMLWGWINLAIGAVLVLAGVNRR